MTAAHLRNHIPVAILCSDLHLRHNAPSARAEQDWYPVMKARLEYLKDAAEECNVPIICAGDVFDQSRPPSELISFAMDHLPKMYCIPGQHDLPNHVYDLRDIGAYGIMVKAGRIIDLPAETWTKINDELAVWASPWGRYLDPTPCPYEVDVRLGVLHKYVWSTPDTKYVLAGQESHVTGLAGYLQNLDAVCIGDNHIPHHSGKVFNHGGFIPQNADQKSLVPRLGLLMADGSVELLLPHPSGEGNWADNVELAPIKRAAGLVGELENLQAESISFSDALDAAASKAHRAGAKDIILSVKSKVQGN